MTQNAANTVQKNKQDELDAQIAVLKPVFSKVILPLTLASALKFGIIHLVGKKLFPNTFTSLGRTYGILYLVGLLTKPLKPTKEMKAVMAAYDQNAKIAR